MSVTAADVGTYLGIDPTPLADRLNYLITLATQKCQSVVDPLPDGADSVVIDLVVRALNNPASARSANLGTASVGFGTSGSGMGGLYLTRANKADLRRMAGGGGAFTVDLTPPDLTLPTVPWDVSSAYPGGWDVPAS